MQEPGAVKVLRGAIAASAATAAALAGHTLGGAPLPGALGVLVPWWLSVAVCSVLVGRRITLPRLSAAVLASQVLFHLLFVAGSVDFFAAPAAGGAHAGHGASAAPGADAAAHAAGLSAHAGMSHAAHAAHLSAPMLLGHLAAAVLTVLVLHRGDRLLAQLGRLPAEATSQLREGARALAARLLAPLASALPDVPASLLAAPLHRARVRPSDVVAEPWSSRAPPRLRMV